MFVGCHQIEGVHNVLAATGFGGGRRGVGRRSVGAERACDFGVATTEVANHQRFGGVGLQRAQSCDERVHRLGGPFAHLLLVTAVVLTRQNHTQASHKENAYQRRALSERENHRAV
jgi:hypothetical protein